MPARSLVLASASPSRLRLLEQIGVHPLVVVSGVSEDGAPSEEPASLARQLAERKAGAVAAFGHVRSSGRALVLGCDSVLSIDGTAHGKPGDAAEATQRWRAMRGREAVLLTGHCLIDTGCTLTDDRRRSQVAATLIRFGQPSDAEIDAYVATGEPLGVAGGFTLDGRSAPFIDSIDGDASNVIGLSLPLLRRMLLSLGVALADVQEPTG